MREAVENAPDEVLANARITEAIDAGRGEWAEGLRGIYSASVEHFGKRTYSELTDEGDFDFASRAAMNWIQKHGLERSTLLTDTSKQEVREVLRRGLAEGRSIAQIARDIEEHYSERGKQRARTAAITEIVGSSNFGSVTAARQSGVARTKTWADASDNRVREAHGEADGQEVALNEPFVVGGFEMDFPGDFRAPAHLAIGCRCAVMFGI